MISNRSKLPIGQVSIFDTPPIASKCDITVRTRGSPSVPCVGSGFRGHLVVIICRNILELLVYYLMPDKCKKS